MNKAEPQDSKLSWNQQKSCHDEGLDRPNSHADYCIYQIYIQVSSKPERHIETDPFLSF